MQKEIDDVLGEAEPRLEDRDKLHYVNAVSKMPNLGDLDPVWVSESGVGSGQGDDLILTLKTN